MTLCIAAFRSFWKRRPPVRGTHLRGRSLLPDGSTRALPAVDSADGCLQWGRLRLPERAASGHFAFVGATGSGKTILQRLLMQSVLPKVGAGLGQRALIYDAKQDLLSILAGMGLRAPIHLLHPMDRRAVAWDMAGDVLGPNSALQVAAMLIPKSNKDTNPFFANAARHLLFGVLSVFVRRRPGDWSFRQLLLAVREPALLEQILEQDVTTRHLLRYFDHEGTFQNIVSTILTCTAPYETIAAAWDGAKTKLSLRQWLNGESVLVLGNDESNRVAVDTLNRMVFQRIAELLLAEPEVDSRHMGRTWFFLDEVREMGRLEGLSRLLTKGRSKGAAVVLGLQDISGLRDVYGREVAEEILGQCNSKAILRLNSPETAAWASRLFGSREILESATTESRGSSSRRAGMAGDSHRGEAISNSISKREVVLDSEFLDLPETSPTTGLSAYFLSPVSGSFRDRLPGPWIAEQLLPRAHSCPDSVPRSEADQYLRAWYGSDDRLLELRSSSPIPPSAQREGVG